MFAYLFLNEEGLQNSSKPFIMLTLQEESTSTGLN